MCEERCGNCRSGAKMRAMGEVLVDICSECSSTLEKCGVGLATSSLALSYDGGDEETTCSEGLWLVDEISELLQDDDVWNACYEYEDFCGVTLTAVRNILMAHPAATYTLPMPHNKGDE